MIITYTFPNLTVIFVVVVVIVIAILLWKRKFKYSVDSSNINTTGFPKEKTCENIPMGMTDVNSPSQLKTVDSERPLGKFEEVEEEHNIYIDLDNPKSD